MEKIAFLALFTNLLLFTYGYNKYLGENSRMITRKYAAERSIPRPNIIKPNKGTSNGVEKFLMMYTCKICVGRNAQMVSTVAYTKGMVISTCKHCKSKHLIADNEGKLDMAEYGKKIEEYLNSKGEKVQKITINASDLEDNYLVDSDGVISLVPKIGGQPSPDVSIIELPELDAPPQPKPFKGFGLL